MKLVFSLYLVVVIKCSSMFHRHARSPSGINLESGVYITRKVSKSPAAKHNEDTNNIYEGDRIELECHYPTNGTWTGKWTFRNSTSSVFIPEVETKGRILRYAFDASVHDDGVYTCHLTDEKNSSRNVTETIRVTKITKPFFENQRKRPYFVHEGDSAYLECDLVGTPHPMYEWMKNGKNYEETSSTLTIDTTTASDNGSFTCRASNRAGRTQQNIELRISGENVETTTDTIINSTSTPTTTTILSTITTATTSQKNKTTIEADTNRYLITVPAQFGDILLVSFLLLIVILVAIVFFISYIQKCFQNRSRTNCQKVDMFDMLLTTTSDTNESTGKKKDVIRFTEEIGKGNFGVVYAGLLIRKATDKNGCSKQLDVAIKSPKEKYDNFQILMLREEFELIKCIPKHPNILTIIGGINDNSAVRGSLHIVFEFCENKSLSEYIRVNKNNFVDLFATSTDFDNEEYLKPKRYRSAHGKSTNLNTTDLISFSYQIANGMDFLSTIPCVHRDLAARNVLLKANKICRIADFGLTRRHENSEYYRSNNQTDVPIRWMSIEAITEGKYTEKSDVWSFAIILFELFSLGELPYKGIEQHDIEDHIIKGNVNKKPVHCNEKIYQLMLQCWKKEPAQRPKFSNCFEFFKLVLQKHSSQKLAELEKLIQSETEKQRDLESWHTA